MSKLIKLDIKDLCILCVCVSHSVMSDSLWLHGLYIACHAPLSVKFSKQEYWSGWPLPSPGNLSNPGIEPMSSVSPALAGRFFTTEPPGKPLTLLKGIQNNTVTLENSLVVSYKTKHTLNHLNQQLHCLVFIQRKCIGYIHTKTCT